LISCKTKTPDEIVTPPSINTGILKSSLIETKDDLFQAGELNNKVSIQLDKAMSLAEQIDVILLNIELEMQKKEDKKVISFETL
jgi:hypothetical protein